MLSTSQIQDFFKNQTIFLTGGSGFLGKLLIEKILRECAHIERIYVLMRPKKGKTSQERFEELFSYPCFDRIKAQDSSVLKKVRLINGDCRQPLLGLGDLDIDILVKETTCVIHAAANVKFDQSLKEASENVRATKDLLQLAKQMMHLKVFVFVSTAFSNCIHPHIKEEFYEPVMSSENFLSVANSLKEKTLEEITPQLIKDNPNTYIFYKSISEDLVRIASKDLPITVVRPAIIMSTLAEPIPGWIDNVYGVIGIVLGASLGVLRSMHAKLDAKAPLVPVDYVANCILAATWQRSTSNDTKTFNYVGHKKTQLTWHEFMAMIEPHCWDAATSKVLWYFCFKLRENKLWHQICVFFLHTVQAYVVDFVLFCLRRPTLAVKSYQRLNKSLEMISYFSTRDWNFDDDNVWKLWEDMNEEDRNLFNFNMEKVNWDEWGANITMGGRKYLLKDESTPESFKRGRRKLRLLFFLHYAVVAMLWYLLYKFVTFVVGMIL